MNPEDRSPEETVSEINTLKNQVLMLLLALIIVSGTLTVFLYRQASLAGKDLAAGEQLSTAIAKTEAENEQAVGTFVGRLVDYGQKHPDFLPVLKKYGLAAAATTPGLPGMPAPAPVAPKK